MSDTEAVVEKLLDRIIARHQDQVLFEYVFLPDLPRECSPRPFFHPVRTLGGVLVTDHQPADHRWHLGLSYSWPVVSEWNLWGGPSFRRDQGYVQLDNHGEIRHLDWEGPQERLEWLDGEGSRLATERRSIGEPEVDARAGAWWLELASEITNVGQAPLRLGSPTTEGRPLAGYAGLSWRGPQALLHGTLLLDDGPAPSDGMGVRSRSLRYLGGGVTIGFFEHPENPRVPNRWFVRTEPFPAVSSSPVFEKPLMLDAGGTLRLRHRLLFADGAWVKGPDAA